MKGFLGLVLLCGGLAAQPSADLPKDRFDRFGGYKGIRRKATGFFRVERIGERWMFITPEGHGYVALGANHVGKFLETPEQSAGFLARFGGDRVKAEDAMYASIGAMGLNAGEAYAPLLPSLARRMPYIANLDFPRKNRFRFDVYDPAVRAEIEAFYMEQSSSFRDDPMAIGVALVDLPVWNERRMEYYRQLPPSAPGKRCYASWLKARYGGIERLNSAYRTNFASFDELISSQPVMVDATRPEVQRDDNAFLGVVADEFYAFLRAAVKRAAPNHLFLGERFVLRNYPDEVIAAVGKHVDVFCTQALILSPRRPPEWQSLQPDGYWHEYHLIGKKPMIVIDWAAPFSLDETYDTASGTVANEAVAAEQTSRWLQEAFQLPFLVGVFKCQLIGSHGNDRWFPKGRMKRTYLKDDGTPFPVRTAKTREAHLAVLRAVYGIE